MPRVLPRKAVLASAKPGWPAATVVLRIWAMMSGPTMEPTPLNDWGKVESHGLVLLVTELGDVGVAVGLERGGASGNDERGDQEQGERGGVRGRHRDDGADHEPGRGRR